MPAQLLQEQPKPKFRAGHTLLPLTRWGWETDFATKVELAKNWGYALDFGECTAARVKQLDDPKSDFSKLVALTVSNPKQYPLAVMTPRPFLRRGDDFCKQLPDSAWCHDIHGKLIETQGGAFLSPEAPDAVFERAASIVAEPLKALRKKAPIAIVLNGGEYPLGVAGWELKHWIQDPKVVKAVGSQSWFEYLSKQKARQEMCVTRAVREQVPDRLAYILYPIDGCQYRNHNDDWWQWTYDYRWMKPVVDLPGSSLYFREFNSGWTGDNDLLTQAINAVGFQIELGEPLAYNWFCSGWDQAAVIKAKQNPYADQEHYMGFLKCCYTAGAIGGCAGFFSYPKGGFAADQGDKMSDWLAQMVTLAHVQALFSHLDDFLRQGDLLPGPNMHRWSKSQPAYEFPTGDPQVRVVARLHRNRKEWLITAWAAGGENREVSVDFLELSTLKLLARKCGSVYRATLTNGKPSLKLIDVDGMNPSAGP